ncbi:MAG: helix-turn-helix transcriptional regulator [Myxococcales bacterium]|nr:helix-turn-helix transcriptional regulator [Myxococcales bacterium]MCB9671030.1 helix-turn-helix transcriptional regulator [Alphaproteobacteria bacterium]
MVADPARLDAVFAALAHPHRRAILERLAGGEASVHELAAPLPVSQPAVSRHLSVLEGAGLVTRGQRGTYRPCTLDAHPLREATEWLVGFRDFWASSYDALDALLAETDAP